MTIRPSTYKGGETDMFATWNLAYIGANAARIARGMSMEGLQYMFMSLIIFTSLTTCIHTHVDTLHAHKLGPGLLGHCGRFPVCSITAFVHRTSDRPAVTVPTPACASVVGLVGCPSWISLQKR